MSRLALLALLGSLGIALPAPAGHGGGGHGGHPGGYHGGYYHGYRGGYTRVYTGFGYGYGYGYGFGFGFAPGYYYTSYPGYGIGGIGYSPPAYGYPVPPNAPPGPLPPGAADPDNLLPPVPTGTARILVRIPTGARLWIDGEATSQKSAQRTFLTPKLESGRTHAYELRARWNQDGRVVEETREIHVRANRTTRVDFTVPVARPSPALEVIGHQPR